MKAEAERPRRAEMGPAERVSEVEGEALVGEVLDRDRSGQVDRVCPHQPDVQDGVDDQVGLDPPRLRIDEIEPGALGQASRPSSDTSTGGPLWYRQETVAPSRPLGAFVAHGPRDRVGNVVVRLELRARSDLEDVVFQEQAAVDGADLGRRSRTCRPGSRTKPRRGGSARRTSTPVARPRATLFGKDDSWSRRTRSGRRGCGPDGAKRGVQPERAEEPDVEPSSDDRLPLGRARPRRRPSRRRERGRGLRATRREAATRTAGAGRIGSPRARRPAERCRSDRQSPAAGSARTRSTGGGSRRSAGHRRWSAAIRARHESCTNSEILRTRRTRPREVEGIARA